MKRNASRGKIIVERHTGIAGLLRRGEDERVNIVISRDGKMDVVRPMGYDGNIRIMIYGTGPKVLDGLDSAINVVDNVVKSRYCENRVLPISSPDKEISGIYQGRTIPEVPLIFRESRETPQKVIDKVSENYVRGLNIRRAA